jgi:hypothetical protein
MELEIPAPALLKPFVNTSLAGRLVVTTTIFPVIALEKASQMNTVIVVVATPLATTLVGAAATVDAEALTGPAT